MGIKYFFSYFKERFPNRIKNIRNHPNSVEVEIDNLLIDMNGIFHNCAQKVYEYGNFQNNHKNLLIKKKTQNNFKLQQKFFESVGEYIEMLFNMVGPKKRLIMCVDGVAPMSKQNQQRQRRFRAALEKKEEEFDKFDSNSITPGTKLMDNLGRYIDWFIHKKMTEDEDWSNLEIIFSNEKAPSEGEHKLIQFIKRYGSNEESYMVQGMDADLIMLSLASGRDHFYILREDHRSTKGNFFIIDVDNFKTDLIGDLVWDISKGKGFQPKIAIYDFILMCFTVGNDFLPHIPTIGILEGGLEVLIDAYKKNGEENGHLIELKGEEMIINKKALESFFRRLATFENLFLNTKMTKGSSGNPDPLLIKHSTWNNEKEVYECNFEKYQSDFYRKKLGINKDGVKGVCLEYIKGLNWVLNYYINSPPSWEWMYPYHYAPFFIDLAENTYSYSSTRWGKSEPILPFQQLLCVLPTKSFGLIPAPLNHLVFEENELRACYPDEIKIDLDGTRNNWEGIVLLPNMNIKLMKDYYYSKIKEVEERDRKRNIQGKSFLYRKVKQPYFFKSFYGDIQECKVNIMFFEL
jgi:5'-3' exoribonuclease 1